MAYFLFIDESGHDRKASPYEVLAGVAVEDRDLWNLILAMHEAEIRHFARRYSQGPREIKGMKMLDRRVFQHAQLNAEVPSGDRREFAKFALDFGAAATVRHLKALALAKLDYVTDILDICARFHCKAFASIVETTAPPPAGDGLRKDYAYLFERFFYFLEDRDAASLGVIVFDELEKTKSHLLIDQTHRYFRDFAKGRHRASRIVPEPFFVHSDLTTGIQLADLVAYIVSWGFRTSRMTKPERQELAPFARQVAALVTERPERWPVIRSLKSGASLSSPTSGRAWSVTSMETSHKKRQCSAETPQSLRHKYADSGAGSQRTRWILSIVAERLILVNI